MSVIEKQTEKVKNTIPFPQLLQRIYFPDVIHFNQAVCSMAAPVRTQSPARAYKAGPPKNFSNAPALAFSRLRSTTQTFLPNWQPAFPKTKSFAYLCPQVKRQRQPSQPAGTPNSNTKHKVRLEGTDYEKHLCISSVRVLQEGSDVQRPPGLHPFHQQHGTAGV